MATFIDNISIKNKIIFGLLFTLFLSLGIGIIEFNKIVKIQKNYEDRYVLTLYKNNFIKLQNLYFKLDATMAKIANSNNNDDFVKNSNEFKSLDIDISSVFIELENIDIKNLKDQNTINFLSSFNDTLFKYEGIYNDNIKLSVNKLIEYKYLIIHPEKIKDDYERLVNEQQHIGVIVTSYDEEYTDKDEVVEELVSVYEKSINDITVFITNKIKSQTFSLDKISYNIQEETNKDEQLITGARRNTIISTAIIFSVSLILILIISFVISGNVIKPLTETNEIILNLSKGKFPKNIDKDRTDEIGLIVESLESLVTNLKHSAEFAKEISGGNFDYKFYPASDTDVLGNSLIQLRESLLSAKREEENRKLEDYRRSRTADGLAKFSDILRQNQHNLKKLGSEVISNLVKFLNCNQGVIFLLNDEDKRHIYLDILSAYAWNREKFIEKKLELGEGLIGAVAVEKFTVYMTDVPEDYIEIKSGTGAANPRSILIVPLKVDTEVLGVVELASFRTFDQYEIELVEKIAESIGSTLKSVRISAQTTDLLEKFQIQAAEMKEQETAMRSTIDELKKAHDERRKNEDNLRNLVRDLEEANKQIKYKDEIQKLEIQKLTQENDTKIKQISKSQKQSLEILNFMMTAVLIIKRDGIIDFVNIAAEDLWGYNEMEILGLNVEKLLLKPPEAKDAKLCEFLFENMEKIKHDKGKDFIITIKDGKTQKVHLEMMIIEAEKEEDMRMVLFLKDTERFAKKVDMSQEFINELAKKDFQNSMLIEKYTELLEKNNIPLTNIDIDKKQLIKWGPKFELGISMIDNQHKRWIEFINKLYEVLNSDDKDIALNEIFKKLMDYTDYHFGFEEKYMKEFNYQDFDNHHINHQKFVNRVIELFTEYVGGSKNSVFQLIILLKSWVTEHVTVTDKKYVDLFKKHGIR